jgi:hypothetical protein
LHVPREEPLHAPEIRDVREARSQLVEGLRCHAARSLPTPSETLRSLGPVRAMFTLYWALILFGIGLYSVIGATHN